MVFVGIVDFAKEFDFGIESETVEIVVVVYSIMVIGCESGIDYVPVED
jgi:hypothetical protein